MAPKKVANNSTDQRNAANSPKHNEELNEKKAREAPKRSTKSSAKKRKAKDDPARGNAKSARHSSRGAAPTIVDPVKLINYLLSPEALPFCRPKDEGADIEARGKQIRVYSESTFTPFEELECALILSRPIGHMLGLRSIRTLFNEPHNLTSPKAIRTGGREACIAALNYARTQHRQKTGEELVLLADSVANSLGKGEEDVYLERLRDECGHDAEKEREMLKKNVKGMAKTGIDIFARRIQGVWKEWYPFADDKTLKAIEDLGLKGDELELVKILEDNWKEIRTGDFHGSDEEKKRKVFVKVLERAIGAELQGNTEDVKKVVGRSG
ncbi:uncharacterized protein KY384_008401 [Bacidia gigantensis]|uniref:uncharacterized protein n=1 Tax=Bacidia gigantensis TaxID=2732470 RepID=UPI001D03CA08|nr:uncharacterized protein KY384_008401 [Bacidia gigantensis]KAG8526972.1 hypothetical protein KY384_008401 [Bacidia gigantensis]